VAEGAFGRQQHLLCGLARLLLSVFGGWQYGFVAADCAGAVLFY